MSARALARALLLAAALAVATAAFGWWTVPLIAAVWGWVAAAHRRPVLTAALAAAAAWAALLAWTWTVSHGGASALATMLGGVVGVPGAALVAITLLFATLLAACAAQLGVAARRQFI